MIGRKLLGLVLVAGACVAVSACGGSGGSEATPTGISVVVVTQTGPATPRFRRTPTPTPEVTATPLKVCGPNPDPVSNAVLQVQEPAPEWEVRIPFYIRGWVSRGEPLTQTPTASPTPEATPTPEGSPGEAQSPTPAPTDIPRDGRGVYIALVDQKQTVVQTNLVPLGPRDFRIAPPGLQITGSTRPFSADIVLNGVQEPTPYCLWVFLETSPEGKARGVLQIPVVIRPQ